MENHQTDIPSTLHKTTIGVEKKRVQTLICGSKGQNIALFRGRLPDMACVTGMYEQKPKPVGNAVF
jgi:hypothetical protein